MRSLTFTTYPNETSGAGKPKTLPWEGWTKALTEHEIRPEKSGPAIILGEIPKGRPRAKSEVTFMHAMGIDVEHHTEDRVAALLDVLAPFEFVIYSTHRHGTEPTPRFRFILPLAEPVPAAQWPTLWARLNMLALGMNDPKTKDCSRLFYLPSAPSKKHVYASHNAGRWLTPDDLPNYLKEVPKSASPMAIKHALADLTKKLKYGLPKDHPCKEGTKALLSGQPFAEPGERHEFILELTWWIAYNVKQSIPPEAVSALFAPSLASMPDTDQKEADVANAFIGALERVALAVKERNEATRAIQLEGEAAYTVEDLAKIASVQKFSDLTHRWVVQKDASFYFLKADGYYSAPSTYLEARQVAAHHLKRAPVLINEPTRTGIRRRPITEIVEDFGCVAEQVEASLAAQHTTYDPLSRTIIEAACPRRPITPKRDARIERWLILLGGPLHEKLLDWLAVLPDLDKLLCALYLSGSSGAGKTLLAKGLAKIWGQDTTEIDKILDNNNDSLMRCPLVLADEAVPRKWKGNPTTTILRTLISTMSRTLSRKYKASANLYGSVRVILTANNEFLLQDADDAPGANDREAVARRFLYIETPPAASSFLKKLEGEISIQDEWIEKDGIARHCLWLWQTRSVRKEGGLWVEGGESAMARNLAIGGSDWNQWVCEWLVGYLTSPNVYDARKDGHVRRGGGELLVNGSGLSKGWNLYLKTKRDPDTHRIGAALSAISGNNRVQRSWRGARMWYHRIDLTNLADWCRRTGIGDVDALKVAVAGPMGADEVEVKGKGGLL